MSRVLDKAALAKGLSDHPLFRSVQDGALSELVDRCMVIHLAAGDLLYEAGGPADRAFVLLSGALQVEHPTEQNEKRGFVVAIFAAPSFLGECQVVQETCWSGSGVALTPVSAIGLTKAELEQAMRRDPELGVDLYRDLTRRFLTFIDARRRQAALSPPQLIARYLLAVTDLFDASELPLSQREIGRAAGLRRETVNRVLKGWVEEGRLVTGPTGLSDLRRERLLEIMEGADAPPLLQSLSE